MSQREFFLRGTLLNKMDVAAIGANAPSKEALYQEICKQLNELLSSERNLVANASNASALLKQMLPDVNWVGFYFSEGRELVVGPFQGMPSALRIPLGQGVCGQAAQTQRTILVTDVSEFEGYIRKDPASRSEIAVPLVNWGKLHGVLNIDSASLNRFDVDDEEGLESVAAVFISSLVSDDMPDLSEQAAWV